MKVGFIGLGIMGRPMAKNLCKAGYDLVFFDFNQEAVADLVSCGATAAKSSKEAASEAEVVKMCIRDRWHRCSGHTSSVRPDC